MSSRGDRVLEEALGLPPEERAELAERLLASLDCADRRRIDELWAEEAERRLDAYEQGKIKAIPARKAIADAIKKQTE